jgi:hypothetical protein
MNETRVFVENLMQYRCLVSQSLRAFRDAPRTSVQLPTRNTVSAPVGLRHSRDAALHGHGRADERARLDPIPTFEGRDPGRARAPSGRPFHWWSGGGAPIGKTSSETHLPGS